MKYCNSLTKYSRFKTREVKVGDIGIGGSNPIRVQSMTTTDTMDVSSTVAQSLRLVEAGCEIIRITAPSISSAKNLELIKKSLEEANCYVPLVADIHFTPNAAEVAARIVQKVRVNPGNYADKKKFNIIEYSDFQYEEELERIRIKFSPLVEICKSYGTAMRIGTNHGSLSDRILSRYGDTPIGMVESAMEFVRICESLNFRNIVLSMKASNTQVMVQAYRLLMQHMIETDRDYPLHLGVTEAGDGEDGRIKSAVGIGALMEDGIGDTIRVSLTEEPEAEIPVAKKLVSRYDLRSNHEPIQDIIKNAINPFEYQRRQSNVIENIGYKKAPIVLINLNKCERSNPHSLTDVGYTYDAQLDKWKLSEMAADYIYLSDKDLTFEVPGSLRKLFDYSFWIQAKHLGYPLFNANEYFYAKEKHPSLNFISLSLKDLVSPLVDKIKEDKSLVIISKSTNTHAFAEQRRLVLKCYEQGINAPIVFRRVYTLENEEDLQISASADLGGLFLDGMGDGICIESTCKNSSINSVSFGILQATRMRISKTEYIACPSCGRTLFDLQEVTAMIRSRTDHLVGVKIGIMGCIVNGPGEMADADYGYVGSGPGKISLYRGQEVVQRGLHESIAVDALINIIKEDGNWVERS